MEDATVLVLDVENTTTKGEKRDDYSPYNPRNKLVSVGWCFVAKGEVSPTSYRFFHHNDLPEDYDVTQSYLDLQEALDKADYIVGHNIKHDLEWLFEAGFTYSGGVYDTMIGEYVLQRGRKVSLSLEDVAIRRKCPLKKSDLVRKYLKEGKTFAEIPIDIVIEYGQADVNTTAHVVISQCKDYITPVNVGLVPTMGMMNEFCSVLVRMQQNGIYIDRVALEQVKEEFEKEKKALTAELNEIIYEVMGDTPINLDSPEQLSTVIYSRRLVDKKRWATELNIGLDERGKKKFRTRLGNKSFGALIKKCFKTEYKTTAKQCSECKGRGTVQKLRKDGTPYKKRNLCKNCDATGLVYVSNKEIAGLKLMPTNVHDAAMGGFATGKTVIDALLTQAKTKGNETAVRFLTAIRRLNAVSVYLNSFVGGMERNVQEDNILHPQFNQTITSTGRLSSSDPNFQNQPRGKTFPVRRVVKSRFPGGKILEADYAQLEFRCAGILSGDDCIARDIASGVDAHSYTATVLTENGQPTDRQTAKAHTFKPLYGGLSGTPAEKAYYKDFLTNRYKRTGEWHKELVKEALDTQHITLPTGRQYYLPAKRQGNWVSFSTQIKNYPVQGFATADIVPLANVLLHKYMEEKEVRSLLINTVHDSIVIDVYPGEEEFMTTLLTKAMLGVKEELQNRYNVDITIPLEIEVKIGDNWLDGKPFLVANTEGKIEWMK